MSPVAVAVAFGAGLVGGALVPMPAYRLSVPADEPHRSTCISCGRLLPAGLTGWVRLQAACIGCGTRLGPRAWATATVAALASAFLAAALGPSLTLPLYVAMVVLGVLLAAIDLACKRLPHALVVPSIWVTGALFAIVAALTGEWGSWVRALIAGAILFVVFLGLWLVPGQGLGFGDVKLAALLGIFLGWLSWGAVLLGGMLPWLVNGPIVVSLLIARRVGRKTFLPFGPAMLAGAMLSIMCVAWLRTWSEP